MTPGHNTDRFTRRLTSRATRSRELEIALETISAAASLALDEQDAVGGPQIRFKEDDSPITAADLDVESLIVDRLGTFFPKARFLGEEEAGHGKTVDLSGDVWVIDPIDGTTNYTLGLSIYAVSIGLLRDGVPILGVISLPRVRELFFCDQSTPAVRNNREIMAVADDFERHQFLCMPSSALKWYHLDFSGNIRAFGSTVYHMLLVARGVAVGAFVRPFLWDIAGALPLLRKAGGELYSMETGQPVDLNEWAKIGFKPFPMVACAPRHLERLRSSLRIDPNF